MEQTLVVMDNTTCIRLMNVSFFRAVSTLVNRLSVAVLLMACLPGNSVAASPSNSPKSVSCSSYSFHWGVTKGSEDHVTCFSQKGTSTTYLTDKWTIPSSDQWTYVGWQGGWHNDNAKSGNLQLSSMKYALNRSCSLGMIGTNRMEGAEGYMRVYSDNNDAGGNKYIGFIPAGYVLRWGTDGSGWTSTAFVPNDSEDIEEEDWETPLQTWTSSNADDYTYVGLKTSSSYVWSNRSEVRRPVFLKPTSAWDKDGANFAVYYFTADEAHNGWSAIMDDPDGDGIYEAWIPNDYDYTKVIFVRLNTTASTGWGNKWNQTTNLTLPADKNVFTITGGSGDAYTGEWSLYDKRGTFHISANSNTNNWYCHFLPHHVLNYDKNDNDASGSMDVQSVAVNAASKSVSVSANSFTAPAGKHFVKWNTQPDANGTDYSPASTYTLSGDATLYAVWEWNTYTVTYHAGETTHEESVTHGGTSPAYTPSENCSGNKVFVGWSTVEVLAVQQSNPTTYITGEVSDIKADTDLYAVYASRNGSGGYDYSDNFNSYTTVSSYTNSYIRKYGIWDVKYGGASNVSDVLSTMGSNALVLQKYDGVPSTMTTRKKIHNFTGILCNIATNDNSVYFTIQYSADGSSWTNLQSLTRHYETRFKYLYERNVAGEPVDAYVKISLTSGTTTKRMYIDDVVLHTKPHDWVLTDYSTTCDKQTGSATLTWNNGDEDVTVSGSQPASQAIGGNITLPTLTRDNYIFDGWEVTAVGQSKAPGIYYGGETFLVNHDMTFDAHWTQLFAISNPTYGVTSAKDITTTSLPCTFSTSAAETAARPVVNAISDDARFAVTITSAEKVGGDSVYTYVYTYTPDAYGSGSGAATNTATVTFREPVTGVTSAPITLRGRSLPDEFVIAVKNGDQWVALPNTLTGTQEAQEAIVPLEITVNDNMTPTVATYAPTTATYTAAARYQDANNTALRFTNDGSHWLQVSATAGVNTVWLSASEASNVQDWQLKSANFNAYELTIPSNTGNESKKMAIYDSEYMGYHSNEGAIYLLPIINKFTKRDAGVYEWGEHGVIVQADMTDVASVTVHIDNADPSAATLTAVNAASLTSGKYVKVDAGELTVGAAANDGKLLYLHWKNAGGTEIAASQIKIPYVVATDGAMKTLISTKDTWATKEVHVLPGATLTADAGSFGSSAVTVPTMFVYPGATLNVSTGTLTVTTLRLRNGWTRAGEKQYNTARVYIADDAALVKTTASIDYDIYEQSDGRHYYPFAVPFETLVSDIDYADTYLAGFSTYGTHYGIDRYDGKKRAEYGGGDNWIQMASDATLRPGVGYTITAVPVKGEAIIRVPLTFDDAWTSDGEKASIGGSYDRDTVSVAAYTGTATGGATSNKRHAGWNMLAVPYMSCYTTGTDMYGGDGDAVLIQGKMEVVGGSDPYGGYSDEVIYVSVPTHDFSEYMQTNIEETVLVPGWSFFIQAGKTGKLHFLNTKQATSSSTPLYAPQRTEEEMEIIRTGIILSSTEASDKTTILVSNRYSSDYEIGADLEKMFGNGYTLATYSLSGETRLAYNAMSTTDAQQVIPIGFRAPADGEYTFSLNPRYADAPMERVDLIDYQAGTLTNLLTDSYTFVTTRTQDDSRFALNVKLAPKVPTGHEEVQTDDTSVFKLILNDKMYIVRGKMMYDATGKRVNVINK